jgi:hypothetical protein
MSFKIGGANNPSRFQSSKADCQAGYDLNKRLKKEASLKYVAEQLLRPSPGPVAAELENNNRHTSQSSTATNYAASSRRSSSASIVVLPDRDPNQDKGALVVGLLGQTVVGEGSPMAVTISQGRICPPSPRP